MSAIYPCLTSFYIYVTAIHICISAFSLFPITPNFRCRKYLFLCELDNGHWPDSRGFAGPIILYNRVAWVYFILNYVYFLLGIYIQFVLWSPISHYLLYVYQIRVAFPFTSFNTRSSFFFFFFPTISIDLELRIVENWFDTLFPGICVDQYLYLVESWIDTLFQCFGFFFFLHWFQIWFLTFSFFKLCI